MAALHGFFYVIRITAHDIRIALEAINHPGRA